MSTTTYLTDAILNHVYRNTALTSPTAVYAGLLEAVTDKEAGTVTETNTTNYGGYARQAITFGAPAGALGGRQVTNSSAVTFPAKSNSGTATMIALGVYDAVSAGNLLDVILLSSFDPINALVEDADLVNNDITSPAHGLVADDRVRFEAVPGGSNLPAGLSENTTYWVISTGLATDTFRVSATQGGAAVDITAVGRMQVQKLVPITVAQNDQPQFGVGTLKITKD